MVQRKKTDRTEVVNTLIEILPELEYYQMCGLTKKQVKKRIKKKGMIVLLLDSEVQENFKKYMPKG